jgi:hypothetical protein
MIVELLIFVKLYGSHYVRAFSLKNYEVTERGRVQQV